MFENNVAEKEGGVLRWEEVLPRISSNNIYSNNVAVYGKNIASFPFRIEMQYSHYYQEKCLILPSKDCYYQYRNLGSGVKTNISISFSIKDIYNNTIESLDQEFIFLIFF